MAATRRPRLMHRMLFADLLRGVLFTTLALEVVIAFAVAVQPLADVQVGPIDALRLMLLAFVPMLQFSLPFAAGFAATMAYYRFASDNEAKAAMAGGVSHLQLIMPAIILSLILGVVMLALSDRVIPSFLKRMEHLLTRDVIRYVVSTVERGESIQFERTGWQMYAQSAVPAGAADGYFERLLLEGVLMIDADRNGDRAGMVNSSLYADEVHAFFSRDTEEDASALVQLRFENASGNLPGSTVESGRVTTLAIPIPSTFRDDPKFRSFSDLSKMREKPEMLDKIDGYRRNLVRSLERLETMRIIQQDLRRDEVVELRRADERLILRGRDLSRTDNGWAVINRGIASMIELEWERADGSRRIQRARRAWIEEGESAIGGEALAGAPLVLRLRNVVTVDPDGRAADAEREELTYSGVVRAQPVRPDLDTMSVDELVEESRMLTAGMEDELVNTIRAQRQRLIRGVDGTLDEITSKLHERFAITVACVLMITLGSIVGLHRGDSLPLHVYMWGFFPATFALVTIGAGQQVTEESGSGGLYLLWGGVIALAIVTILEYRQLRRH